MNMMDIVTGIRFAQINYSSMIYKWKREKHYMESCMKFHCKRFITKCKANTDAVWSMYVAMDSIVFTLQNMKGASYLP